jgi:putative MATE family efflux protein
MILFGICSGGAIFTSQYWGKKDILGIRKYTGLCLILNSIVAALFTVAVIIMPERIISIYSRDPEVIKAGALYLTTLAPSYIPFGISFVFMISLRSIERVNLAMVSTLIALSLNVVGNYLLIFGIGPFPELGVQGAAISTVFARITETIILVSVSYRKKYPMAGSLKEFFSAERAFIGRFMRITSPVILNELMWAMGISVQNIIFARTGTDAIAAFNITNTVSQLTWVVFIGLGNGVAVLIGKCIGEGREERARDYARRITKFAPLLAAVLAALLFPLSRLIPFVFNVNAAVISHTMMMFVVLCLSYPFRAFNMCLIVGVCRAGGDTIFCVLFEIIFMWGFSLPFGAVMAFFFQAPVWIIYLCICTEDIFKMFCGIWRLKSGRWLNNVT